MIRTFIAVDVNPETRAALARDLSFLKREAPRVKWSSVDNLHLTLKFLGDVKENDLDELFSALDEALTGFEPFVIAVGGIGVFPHWRTPRIVWAGCGDGADEATRLQRVIDRACADLGYEAERRPFQPHLTLGRVKLPADADGLREAVDSLGECAYGFIDADAVCVYMSELRRAGPVYSPMLRVDLRPAGMGNRSSARHPGR